MPTTDRRWTRFFFYRKEVLKTTWTLRLLVLASVLLLPWITRGLWAGAVAKGLLCAEQGSGTGVDAIVVENFDVNYLVFERAALGNELRILQVAGIHATPPRQLDDLVANGCPGIRQIERSRHDRPSGRLTASIAASASWPVSAR